MTRRRATRVKEGDCIAEVEVERIEADEGWAPHGSPAEVQPLRICLGTPRGPAYHRRMGSIREAAPVKLIVGMLSAYPGAMAEAESRLVSDLGPVEARSDLFAHAFTEYYRDEMGQPLLRYFVSFERLIEPARLADAKHLSNQVETDVAARDEWPVVRPVNLDPGYVDTSKLVLASTKDFAHRVYLGRGIWAEVTLRFKDGAWVDHEWTYPDYRTREYHDFFTRVRDRLREQRKTGP